MLAFGFFWSLALLVSYRTLATRRRDCEERPLWDLARPVAAGRQLLTDAYRHPQFHHQRQRRHTSNKQELLSAARARARSRSNKMSHYGGGGGGDDAPPGYSGPPRNTQPPPGLPTIQLQPAAAAVLSRHARKCPTIQPAPDAARPGDGTERPPVARRDLGRL